MRGAVLVEALRELCRGLDLGRVPRGLRIGLAVAPLMLPLGAATVGCGPTDPSGEQGDDACSDGIDNDSDGQVDCEDPGCVEAVACAAVGAYGAPFPEDCGNGVDDNGDGEVDCDDSLCVGDPRCDAATPHAAPFEERCDDSADDDGDGLVDCDDPDCDDHDVCAGESGSGG